MDKKLLITGDVWLSSRLRACLAVLYVTAICSFVLSKNKTVELLSLCVAPVTGLFLVVGRISSSARQERR